MVGGKMVLSCMLGIRKVGENPSSRGAQKKGSNLVINGVTLSLYKRKLVINAEDHALARFIVGFLTL